MNGVIDYKIYSYSNKPSTKEQLSIVNFLFHHLGEYGDLKEDINKAIEYTLDDNPLKGGVMIVALEDDKLLGATVINKTGMEGYIPENILVYIAVHEDARGKGVGTGIMNKAITHTDGDIALHVEPHNPAKKLYEKLGFTNKYLEMRLQKSDLVS